jgi:hypothetical protein
MDVFRISCDYRRLINNGITGVVMQRKFLALVLMGICVNAQSLVARADGANSVFERNNWIEMGAGSVSTLTLKSTLDNKGWALAYSYFDDLEILGDGHFTKDGSQSIDDNVVELALMRTFSKHGRWFYSDASIGIGYMDATLAENCEGVTTTGGGGFFGGWSSTKYFCDEKRKKGLSIPIELDIAFGRYVGLGLKLRASIGPESIAGVALTIPLGGFAKK